MTPIILVLVFLLSIFFICWLFRAKFHPWLIENAKLLGSYRSIAGLILFPLALLGGVYTYSQVIEKLEKPSVALEFVHKKLPAVGVRNTSKSTVVQQPKYMVVLFNLDSRENEMLQPLPIPVKIGNYIKPGIRWGPNAMLSIPNVKSKIKEGDILIGYANVRCPECDIRKYAIYIKVGESGWYVDLEEAGLETAILKFNTISKEKTLENFEKLIPVESRINIE